MTARHLKNRMQSLYDTFKLIPAEIIEQDLRLHAIRNQLAILLDDLETPILLAEEPYPDTELNPSSDRCNCNGKSASIDTDRDGDVYRCTRCGGIWP